MAFTILAQAFLPLLHWEDVVSSAVLLINALQSHSLQTFFFLRKRKTKPGYTILKTIGCACFPYLGPYNNHKFDYESIKYIFLGYAIHYKAYKCLAQIGKIYISRHVIFDEYQFPFKSCTNIAKLSSTISPPSPIPAMLVIPKSSSQMSVL